MKFREYVPSDKEMFDGYRIGEIHGVWDSDEWWKYVLVDENNNGCMVCIYYNGNDSYRVATIVKDATLGMARELKRRFEYGIRMTGARHVETWSRGLERWHRFMGFEVSGVEDGLIHWELNRGN